MARSSEHPPACVVTRPTQAGLLALKRWHLLAARAVEEARSGNTLRVTRLTNRRELGPLDRCRELSTFTHHLPPHICESLPAVIVRNCASPIGRQHSRQTPPGKTASSSVSLWHFVHSTILTLPRSADRSAVAHSTATHCVCQALTSNNAVTCGFIVRNGHTAPHSVPIIALVAGKTTRAREANDS